LIGEYAILQGGAALIMTTAPNFELQIYDLASKSMNSQPVNSQFMNSQSQNFDSVFHPKSPAGKWIQKNPNDFKNHKLVWNEAYEGRGGFGASTAQFLAVWLWSKARKLAPGIEELKLSKVHLQNLILNWKKQSPKEFNAEILNDYWDCSWSGEGTRPSGADLIAQFHGGIVYFDSLEQTTSKAQWPWPEADVFLISTGFKLPTHEHLTDLKDQNFEILQTVFEKSKSSFLKADLKSFSDQVNEYVKILDSMDLSFQPSRDLQSKLLRTDLFQLVKGCGAMGVDVLFAVADHKNKNKIEELLKSEGLTYWRTLDDLSEGAQVAI
jgi:mevalonate kinase